MQRIWAPWREQYITVEAHKVKGCLFCHMNKAGQDKKSLIFARGKHCFAVLNLYPYNNGHTLVVPNRHIRDTRQLSAAEQADFWGLMHHCQNLLDKVLSPQGFNIGMNLGKVAGAGVPGHVHLHIVPRWRGDVNFMPVMNNTRVISQSLARLYQLLSKEQKKTGAKQVRPKKTKTVASRKTK